MWSPGGVSNAFTVNWLVRVSTHRKKHGSFNQYPALYTVVTKITGMHVSGKIRVGNKLCNYRWFSILQNADCLRVKTIMYVGTNEIEACQFTHGTQFPEG